MSTGLRRARAGLLALLLAVLAAVVLAPPASACSCTHRADDPVLFERATVVFVGTVVDDRRRDRTRTLTFAVDRVLKGAATSQQQVRTHVEPATCGLELQGTGPFLVQARGELGGLAADLCGGTRAAVRSAGLDTGYPPMPGGGPPSDAAHPWRPTGAVASVAVAALAVLGSAALLRRRSRRPER